MLPGVAGKTINTGMSLNKAHPLAINLLGIYRAIHPLAYTGGFKNPVDPTGNTDGTNLFSCRFFGPDAVVRGQFTRQASGQFPQVPSTIWAGVTTGFTAAFWCKQQSAPNLETALDSTGRDFTIFLGNGATDVNRVQVFFNGNGSGSVLLNRSVVAKSWNRWCIGIDLAGNITIWINGTQAATATHSVTALNLNADIAFANNTSGGGNHLNNGFIADVCFWNSPFSAALAGMDYQEAMSDFAGLMPRFNIFDRAPIQDTSATASGDIGTITLTSPEAIAFENTDGNASGDVGTITLTSPEATAGESNTASGDIGTITLTAPTADATTPDNTASGSIGTIWLQAPTALPYGAPFNVEYQDQYYWGKFSRGQYVHLTWNPPLEPNTTATVDFWHEATTLVRSVGLPILDDEDLVFGMPQFLDEDFDDGNYVAVIRYSAGVVAASTIGYFQVSGGTGTTPVIGLLEIDRALGRAVVMQRANGDLFAGYEPSKGD